MSGSSDNDGDATRPADPWLGSNDRGAVHAFWEGGSSRLPLVDTGSFEVGRSEECELRIDHPSVSRRHLRLHVGAEIAVEDLGSANGSMLNGVRLQPHTPTSVSRGDSLELGSAIVIVQSGAAETSEARANPKPSGEEAMQRLDRLIQLVAQSRINVLLLGETGVGKEVSARAIHARSPRAKKPWIGINCAAIPEALIESELFGFERGAFSGAERAKPGLLETAHGGTFFLDEVNELPAAMQAKLLRVIEQREVQRLGSLSPERIDLRFIAATNSSLTELAEQGRFRIDLLYRLNGITLTVPPLRERTHQIRPLARELLQEAARELERPPPEISPAAMAKLEAHPWPGNVRELKNAMERAVLLSEGADIDASHIELGFTASEAPSSSALGRNVLRREFAEFEREQIRGAMERAGGNQTAAAKLLGVSRRTLMNRLDALGLPRPRKRPPEPASG